MKLTDQLTDYINAAFTGFWIQTFEADEAEREIVNHARQKKWKIVVWDMAGGLRLPGTRSSALVVGLGKPIFAAWSTPFATSTAKAVVGEPCRMISRPGRRCTTISRPGHAMAPGTESSLRCVCECVAAETANLTLGSGLSLARDRLNDGTRSGNARSSGMARLRAAGRPRRFHSCSIGRPGSCRSRRPDRSPGLSLLPGPEQG